MTESTAHRDTATDTPPAADTAVDDTSRGDNAVGDTAVDDTATDGAEDGPVSSSAKEVFAAALEKKKSAGQSRSAHLDGHGGVGGATASHKATRTFRRKSG